MENAPLAPVQVSESAEAKFREYLEIRGEKLTEPRRKLVNHVFNSHKHFDADELVADLREAGRQVSRATVYRTLRLMVDAGLLREVRLDTRTAFEHNYGYPSHDHMHCKECNQLIEFRNEDLHALRDSICEQFGFRPDGHRFVITGVCSSCSRARSSRRRRLDLI